MLKVEMAIVAMLMDFTRAGRLKMSMGANLGNGKQGWHFHLKERKAILVSGFVAVRALGECKLKKERKERLSKCMSKQSFFSGWVELPEPEPELAAA